MDTDNSGPQLATLLNRKFGKHRGRNTRAVKALGVQFSNLSAALSGTTKLPYKHLQTLRALPDFKEEIGISHELADGVNQLITFFKVRMTPEASKQLEIAARFNTRKHFMPDLEGETDLTAMFFEDILTTYNNVLLETNPTAYYKTLDAIYFDKIEARKQLNLELKDRKHLVADELTENEILTNGEQSTADDQDPLA